MKLLIVDDHAGMRAMIRQLGSLPEHNVRECGCGAAAIILAREFTPDVVTMDVRLPGMGGLEATRTILAELPATRVVVVTSYDQPAVRAAARLAGAAAFVAKDDLPQLQAVFARFSPSAPQPDDRRSDRGDLP